MMQVWKLTSFWSVQTCLERAIPIAPTNMFLAGWVKLDQTLSIMKVWLLTCYLHLLFISPNKWKKEVCHESTLRTGQMLCLLDKISVRHSV